MSEKDSDNPPQVPGRRQRLARLLRWLAVAVVFSAAVALAVFGPKLHGHFGPSGAACASCHQASTDDVHAGIHQNLPCSGCHESHFDENLRTYLSGLVSDTRVEHGRTKEDSCKTCHTSGKTENWHLARTQGHVLHVLSKQEPLACSECHDLARHGTAPKPQACVECHSDTQLFDHTEHDMPQGRPAPCLSCHEFLARTDVGGKALATDCRRCHGGEPSGAAPSRLAEVVPAPAVTPQQIHGNLRTCGLCHDPHEEDLDERRADATCTNCHAAVESEHHAQQQPGKFDCTSCHRVHGPRAGLVTSCQSCHEKQTATATAAVATVETLAQEHGACGKCHEAHEFVATQEGCKECHTEQQTALASWDAKKHADCRTCHEAHEPRAETALCVECHQKANHGHEACTTCHEPHQNAASVQSCDGCHQKQRAQLLTQSSAHHSECKSCHETHAVGKTLTACRSCHADEVRRVANAGPTEHKACGSCHQPHAFSAQTAKCNGCHELTNPNLHAGACNTCHEPHGPPLGKAKECANCHAEIPRTPGAHAACSSCHTNAHAPATAAAPSCNGCHTEQAVAVTTWRPEPHKQCSGCHAPHSSTKPAACNSCHAQQAKEVQGTGHRCSSCHDEHTPTPNPFATCASCHGSVAATSSKRGPVHSNCKSCHEPHTTNSPTCNSCHQNLPAAHALPGHERCQDCHSTHAPTTTNRTQCLQCHQRMTNHFPEASSCAGCHLFK